MIYKLLDLWVGLVGEVDGFLKTHGFKLIPEKYIVRHK